MRIVIIFELSHIKRGKNKVPTTIVKKKKMNTILPLSYSLHEPNQFQLFSFFALARFFLFANI